MSFPNGLLNTNENTAAGEPLGPDAANLFLSYDVYEDGIVPGTFVKLDTGSIDKLDGSVTPVVVGPVKRDVSNVTADGETFLNANINQVSIQAKGAIALKTKTGEAITPYTDVTASNTADADSGKGLASGGVATNYQYLYQITTDLWAIATK